MALYAREAEGSTYVDNGITVPLRQDQCGHPSQSGRPAAEHPGYSTTLRMTAPPICCLPLPPRKIGSLHVDMLARMMQMLMNEDFVENA